MKARLVPVFFQSGIDEEFRAQLANLATLLRGRGGHPGTRSPGCTPARGRRRPLPAAGRRRLQAARAAEGHPASVPGHDLGVRDRGHVGLGDREPPQGGGGAGVHAVHARSGEGRLPRARPPGARSRARPSSCSRTTRARACRPPSSSGSTGGSRPAPIASSRSSGVRIEKRSFKALGAPGQAAARRRRRRAAARPPLPDRRLQPGPARRGQVLPRHPGRDRRGRQGRRRGHQLPERVLPLRLHPLPGLELALRGHRSPLGLRGRHHVAPHRVHPPRSRSAAT